MKLKIGKKKINKDSSRVVLHKFSNAVIKKNSSVEKNHIITMIKKHEKLYTLGLASVFILTFFLIVLLIGTSYKHYFKMNYYTSGELTVEYPPSINGIGNVITLSDSNIIEDKLAKYKEEYVFFINNPTFRKLKYRVTIKQDNELIELDGCGNRLFSDKDIKFNINGSSVKYLSNKKSGDEYIIVEDVIPGNSTKKYIMNVWIDKNVSKDDKHFHALIEVDMINPKC